MNDFLAMGGYALYVWGSYGVAALVLVLNLWTAHRREQIVRRELEQLDRLNRTKPE